VISVGFWGGAYISTTWLSRQHSIENADESSVRRRAGILGGGAA